MNVSELLALALLAIFAENVVLVQLLGVRPLLDTSEKPGTAAAVGLLVTVVMGLTCLCTWFFNTYLLLPFGAADFLQTLLFVLTAAAIVRILDLILKKALPALHALLGSQLPMTALNCAVLGAALQSAQNGSGALASTAYGVFAGLGFTVAALLFCSVRGRLEFAECPKAFEGFPIALVSAGLLAMAFLGFSGLQLN